MNSNQSTILTTKAPIGTRYENGRPLYEVVELIKMATTKKEKLDVLKKYDSRALRQVLKLNYDKKCKLSVETSPDKFETDKFIDGFGLVNLHAEAKRMYIYFEEYQKMDPRKRQDSFRYLVESLDPSEAQLLLDACNKKLVLPEITSKDIQKLFPGLIGK